jgi:type IV pilus assembly protein PilM
LELDTGSARAVELSGTPQASKLHAFGCIDLPEGAVEEGMVVYPEAVGEALKRLWDAGGFKSREVLLGVSNHGVMVRYATMPKVPADKLDNVIRYQAQEYLPIPLNSAVLDYLVIGETTVESGAALEVLLVAAQRDMLAGFIEALSIARLELIDIDVSTLALMRVIPPETLSTTVAVVNVANGLSNILVASQGNPRLARLVSVKMKDISEVLGCSLADVFTGSVAASEMMPTVLSAWMKNLSSEIRSSVTYYQGQDGSAEVQEIFLNGRGARLRGIAAELEDLLGLSVRTLDPLERYSNSVRKAGGDSVETLEYAISTGLARRGLEG